jgi:hypothetical protein
MKRRVLTDLVLSALACAVGFLLSWPFWRDFEYWAESPAMWWVYFVSGSLMAFYVFFVFLRCIRTLFLHDTLIKTGYYIPKPQGGTGVGADEEGKP